VRLQLLKLAAADGIVTSTSASGRTGESTANCSFHLRLLARYGFLEPGGAGPTRRERPWRLSRAHPLAGLWQELDGAGWTRVEANSELMRHQLRLFDVDALQIAA
jgi:hypothetical protein